MPREINRQPEPDLKHAVALVTKMMTIPGRSGQEASIMRFICDALRQAGLPRSTLQFDNAHRRSPFGGEVGNLIVKLPGTKPGPRRMLVAHVDTVPLCVGCKPVRRGRWIRSSLAHTALGADNRSGAAAVLSAALAIVQQKLPHPPLTLLWPVQEEVGLVGARYASLRQLGRPGFAFNFDSGHPQQLIVGATGAYRIKIDIHGAASHAGVHPEMGVSAITMASLAISQLQDEGYLGAIRKGRRTGTSNIGVLEGGEATNVVAPRVQVTAEVRSHDRRFRDTILRRFEKAFQRSARSIRNEAGQTGTVRFDAHLDYESFKLSERHPCVAVAQSAVRSVLGAAAKLELVNGGLDANWLTSRGIPTVTLGAGQHGAHTVGETLNVSEFERGCRIALHLATAGESDR